MRIALALLVLAGCQSGIQCPEGDVVLSSAGKIIESERSPTFIECKSAEGKKD